MDCKITIIKTRRCAAAYTLVELMLGIGIGSLLLAAAASFLLFSLRSFAGVANYVEINGKDRFATDMISRDIRNATSVQTATTNQIVLAEPDGNVTYNYDSTNRTLTRTDAASSRILLTGVDSLSFSLYQRPPVTNATYNVFLAAQPANAKMVGFQWNCSRKMTGERLNSESTQMGMVDLRNQQ